MKYLIIGLGNPGSKYIETRHNIGFKVVEAFAKERGGSFALMKHAEVSEVKFKGRSIILVKPTTFMNLSGKAVNYWMQTEKIPKEKFHKNEKLKPDTLSQPVNPVSTICLENLNEVLQVQETACSHLECIVCYDVTAGQVYSCEQDHLLCHDCKSNPNVLTCPICRQNFENIPVRRNRLAEKMIGALK